MSLLEGRKCRQDERFTKVTWYVSVRGKERQRMYVSQRLCVMPLLEGRKGKQDVRVTKVMCNVTVGRKERQTRCTCHKGYV